MNKVITISIIGILCFFTSAYSDTPAYVNGSANIYSHPILGVIGQGGGSCGGSNSQADWCSGIIELTLISNQRGNIDQFKKIHIGYNSFDLYRSVELPFTSPRDGERFQTFVRVEAAFKQGDDFIDVAGMQAYSPWLTVDIVEVPGDEPID